MVAATVQDAVSRFLDDAETAAHQGDTALAHHLMLLALDTRPGDSDVLMRANLIRGTLAAILGEQAVATPMVPESEARVRPRPKGSRRRSDREGSENDLFHPIPGLDGESLDKIHAGNPPASPVIRGLPVAAGASGQAGAGPTIGLIQEEEEVHEWTPARPVLRIAVQPEPVVEEPTKGRLSRGVLYALWGILAASVVAVGLVVAAPGLVGRIINRATNPLAVATEALSAHDYPKAVTKAREALAGGADPAQGNLILGEALLRSHDSAEARAALALGEAADSAGTWQRSMSLGGLLLESGDTLSASKAYYSAYLKSAPLSQFLTIARGRLLAGDAKLPAALLSELSSRRDPGYLADSAQITKLYNRVLAQHHP